MPSIAHSTAVSTTQILQPQTRERAMSLFKEGRNIEALPLLEAWAKTHSSDQVVIEAWAWCRFRSADNLSEASERKKARAQARTIALKAWDLGARSQLLQLMLTTPEDGGNDTKFSDHRDIDALMQAAEADFNRGDLEKARAGYLHVLSIDPDNYDATLFIGDVCFRIKDTDCANEWFARAVTIAPNREMAYRYWGDVLDDAGKSREAREKFIEAFIAEPYHSLAGAGLQN